MADWLALLEPAAAERLSHILSTGVCHWTERHAYSPGEFQPHLRCRSVRWSADGRRVASRRSRLQRGMAEMSSGLQVCACLGPVVQTGSAGEWGKQKKHWLSLWIWMSLLGGDGNLEWTLLLQSSEPKCRLSPWRTGVSGLTRSKTGRIGCCRVGQDTASSQPSTFRSGSPKTYMSRVSLPSKPRNRRPGIKNNWILPRNLVAAHPKKGSRCWAIRFPSPGAAPLVASSSSIQRCPMERAPPTEASFSMDHPAGGSPMWPSRLFPHPWLRRDTTIRFAPRAC